MYRRRAAIFLGLLLGLGGMAWLQAGPPSENFDLSHWKLTLPIDANGGISGTAVEIKTSQLLAGYTSGYFYTDTDGAMVFWCPVLGATTVGSSNPRSELREVIDPNDSTVNWTGRGTHLLTARCKVTKLPSSGKFIIGQIHGYNTNPVVKLQLNHGDVEAVVRSNLSSETDVIFTFPNLGLNSIIDYQFRVVDGVLATTVNGVTYSHDFFTSDPAWRNIPFYFKAGAYDQDNAGAPTEGGRVSFYQVAASHPGLFTTAPAISLHPVSQTVAAGGSVSLIVAAAGFGPLTYQWRRNGAIWPGRTSDALWLSDFQAGDEKDYDVIVSGAGGSVTSSVARLYLNAPMRFVNAGMSNGHFRALLLGMANGSYVVQGSSNNVSWFALATNSSPNGIINFVDPRSTAAPLHYYRAR